MAKRFADTDKYKKPFIRGLPAAYKILWDYICLDCNHAGIWHKDFEIAQIYIGADAPVNEAEALKLFNKDEERIVVLNHGSRWLIKPFVEFQYGNLNPENRVHASILAHLKNEKIKPLASPLQGAMDKDKDKDMEKDKDSRFLKALKENSAYKGIDIERELGKCNAWCIANGKVATQRRFVNWLNRVDRPVTAAAKPAKKPSANCTACNSTGKLPDGKKCWCY